MPKSKQSFQDEPDLAQRIKRQKNLFYQYYNKEAEIIVRSPGRAEILGNHTDYNRGFALACAISRSILALFARRTDKIIRIKSNAFPNEAIEFDIYDIKRDELYKWTNYARAVIKYFLLKYKGIRGADILIDSTIPKSGGVSSSAAFELAIAYGILNLYDISYKPIEVALLCQKAENSNIVRSPCGFLDQGTVAFGKRENMVLFDFLPKENSPVSRIELIPTAIEEKEASFVIAVDPKLERQLGESGYVERRSTCEKSLSFWTLVLGREVKSLRDVSVQDFLIHKAKLDAKDSIMRKRVEHVVFENNRVLEAVKAIRKNNIIRFGELLSESGKSALELYELDENTPQLTHLVEKGRSLPGVLGIRNMGGGFSAIALALVANDAIQSFQQRLNTSYQERFGNNLDFIQFRITNGVEIVQYYTHRVSPPQRRIDREFH